MSGRCYGSLSTYEISSKITGKAILCLPIGACEQHGPHLPLNTDTIIAQKFTERLVKRYGDKYDLWALPAIPYGLSLEHGWADGTVSLRSNLFCSLLDRLVSEHAKGTSAKRFLIINGHGGNRGILESVIYELEVNHSVKLCVLHPSSLSKHSIKSEVPEVHGGFRETSVMMALAPELVSLEKIPISYSTPKAAEKNVRELVLDRGVSWPWTSNSDSISQLGVIGGDPRRASKDVGEAVLESALDRCDDVLKKFAD